MKRTKILFLLSVLMVVGLLGMTWNLYGDVSLAVPEKIQEYSNWCWAGSSQSVLFYYGETPEQCVIANFAWSTTRCCEGSTDFYDKVKGCNKANSLYGTSGSIEGIFANWGVSSFGSDTYLSWNASVSELDNGHPFIMRYGWTNGGGHFLATYGYITNGSYLKYMDPWPGEGDTTALYTWVVSASDHDWTHTLTTY